MTWLRTLSLLAITALTTQVASASSLTLIMNDPTGLPRPLNNCEAEVCTSLLKLIDGAKSTIDFAVYGMRDQSDILRALERAKARGVKLRGAVDMDHEGKNYYSSTDKLIKLVGVQNIFTDYDFDKAQAANKRVWGPEGDRCERPAGFMGPLQCLSYDFGAQCLFAAHASRGDIEAGASIMHDKMFIIDGQYVWTGSTNISDSGTGGYNANLVTVIDNAEVARWYLREMEEFYAGRFHQGKQKHGPYQTTLDDGTKVRVLFSPKDLPISKAVRPELQRAKKSIDVGIFFLTHKHITRDLIDAHNRGVKVRVIIDASGSTNEYTKHEILRAAGIPVKVEVFGGKMHAKSAVIDGRVVIAGSMNWTSAGEGGNDENTIIIDSPTHGATYSAWFDRIWASIPDQFLTENVAPESLASGAACTDGVDNDYDNLVDDLDPGCSTNPPPMDPLPPYRIVPKSDGVGLVKAITQKDGKMYYYSADFPGYDRITINPKGGDKWFCSEYDAKDAGYQRAPKSAR